MNAWIKPGGRAGPFFYLCAFLLVASLLLGGGTRGGFIADAILQFLAIPLLVFALWKLGEIPLTRQASRALAFLLAVVAIPSLQLVPLPPWLWTTLSGRTPSVTAFEIMGHGIPWMPISVSPQSTWLAGLSLLPPLAIFLGVLLLSYRERRWLSLVVLAVGVVSVFVGLVQVAQGPRSALRFFAITNPTEAVGFFANRNHFAAFLYCLILLAACWTVHASVGVKETARGVFSTPQAVAAIGGFTLLVVLLAGEAMARSRAGLGLTIVALFGAFAFGFSDRRTGARITPNKVVFGAIALAVIFSIQYALYRILERFEIDPMQDARIDFVKNTVDAAWAYMPFGSGLGTFVTVYALFEKPQDAVANTFANHAHNDLVEIWLETGLAGLILMGVFASWLASRAVKAWWKAPFGASEIDRSLAQAATIVVGLIVAHSLVDYPLRTGAMMAIMAFACALMLDPLIVVEHRSAMDARHEGARQPRRPRGDFVSASPAESVEAPALGGSHGEVGRRHRLARGMVQTIGFA